MRRANTLNGVFRCLFSWFLLFGRNLFRIVYQGQRIFDIYPHYFPKYMYTRGYRNWILDLNNNTSILFVLNCLWLRWREKVKEQLVLDFFFWRADCLCDGKSSEVPLRRIILYWRSLKKGNLLFSCIRCNWFECPSKYGCSRYPFNRVLRKY